MTRKGVQRLCVATGVFLAVAWLIFAFYWSNGFTYMDFPLSWLNGLLVYRIVVAGGFVAFLWLGRTGNPRCFGH